jgi:predicted nucleic acid-binding protein
VKAWLLDAGPIVAVLNPKDPSHKQVCAALDSVRGSLLTTSAVIAEAFYLVRRNPHGPELLLEFLEDTGTLTMECCQPANLRRTVAWMAQYADTPMDFADATLVLLADEIEEYDIFTLDRRGFRTFRTPMGKRFRLIIDDR